MLAHEALMEYLGEVATYRSILGVLGWDEQVMLPAQGAEHRGKQSALLSRLAHEKMVAPELERLLNDAEAGLDAVPTERRAGMETTLREVRRDRRRAMCLPSRLVEELATVTAAAFHAWVQARSSNDFALFAPHLKRVLALKREEADLVGHDGCRYDALLDEYEPGMRTADVRSLFGALREPLVALVQRAKRAGNAPTNGPFPKAAQKVFLQDTLQAIGFDFTSGRLDESHHPFCCDLGPGDTRMTTRYSKSDLEGALLSALHEAGHGMYDQGLPKDWHGMPPGQAVSLGVHESQSRMWENLVGRSEGFWNWRWSGMQEAFPEACAGLSKEAWLRWLNRVDRTLIRTESDEVTYNLHIMLRFDLEVALLDGDLEVDGLPEAWRAKMLEYLGVAPDTDSQGCLQDVHWSGGALGYFPTYTLGNVFAAQLFEAAQRDLGEQETRFAAGEFAPLLGWLRQHVHMHGRSLAPLELVKQATGERMSVEPLLRHLQRKVERWAS